MTTRRCRPIAARGLARGLATAAHVLVCCLVLASLCSAQNSTPPPTKPAAPAEPVPSNPASSDPAAANSAPGNPTPETAQPQDDETPGFVFKKEVEEVVLHATVVDDQNHLVTGLTRNSFVINEDGKRQDVTSFHKEQVPVALGILIDNSGSMLPKRAKVNEAALQLVDASQQGDRVFVVNFGDNAFLDQDYTQDVGKLRAALQRVETRGSTALYDAIMAAADHLNQPSPLQKKILLVVTDGRDNSSQATFQQVLHKLQSKDSPVVYTIVLEQNGPRDAANRQSLQKLSEQTGGTAFFPSNLSEVQSIASAIAQDIRSQYVIGYRSSNSDKPGTYHTIQVQAVDGSAHLRVETRTGYYSGRNGSDPAQAH